jgi:hypothetical protein
LSSWGAWAAAKPTTTARVASEDFIMAAIKTMAENKERREAQP